MISERDYVKNTDVFWTGKKVRTLRDMSNGWLTIKAGTICIIKRKFAGFALETERCLTCGVAIKISRVQPCDVELVEMRK